MDALFGQAYESYGLVPIINMMLLLLAVAKLVTMVLIMRKLKVLIARSQLEVRRLSETNADVLSFVKNNHNGNGNGNNNSNGHKDSNGTDERK